MRGQTTKLVVAIGAVLVVAGIWYVSKGDKDVTSPVAQNKVESKKTADEPVTSVSFNEPVAPAPQPAANVNTAGAASPTPRGMENPIASPGIGETPRPQPAETRAPVPPPMAATDLPKERPGLSVVPNIGAPVIEPSATTSINTVASSNQDLPPNTDKDVRPAAPVLPPIAPVQMASTSTTKPAAASPTPETEALPSTVAKKTTTTTPPAAVKTTDKPADKPADKLADKAAEKSKTHVVQKGETLSSIAVKYFGSAKYAKELTKANPGLDPNKIYVGKKLNIPETPAGATAKNVTDAAAGSTAKPTDKTADKTSIKTTDKAADKTAVKTTTDKAADKTAAKSTDKPAVKEPAKDKATAAVPPADPNRSYTVQAGEGWYDLARKFLGDGKNYPELYEYNKERVGGDPHLLRAGTVIELPPRAKMPAKTAPQPSAAPVAPAPAAGTTK